MVVFFLIVSYLIHSLQSTLPLFCCTYIGLFEVFQFYLDSWLFLTFPFAFINLELEETTN